MTNPVKNEKTVSLAVTHLCQSPPERVFGAWLSPDLASQFLFRTPSGQLMTCDIDGR